MMDLSEVFNQQHFDDELFKELVKQVYSMGETSLKMAEKIINAMVARGEKGELTDEQYNEWKRKQTVIQELKDILPERRV